MARDGSAIKPLTGSGPFVMAALRSTQSRLTPSGAKVLDAGGAPINCPLRAWAISTFRDALPGSETGRWGGSAFSTSLKSSQVGGGMLVAPEAAKPGVAKPCRFTGTLGTT